MCASECARMNPSQPVIVFGGTFDPVHRAHISAARKVSRVLNGAPVRLLPNAVPPHRPQPGANAEHRLAMLQLACADHPELTVDDRELSRQGPSYTLDTLRELRRLEDSAPLILVLGADSFANLQHWHQWQAFPALCHLVVLPRPGAMAPAPDVIAAFPEGSPQALLETPAGRRLMLSAPLLDVSATAVRQALAEKHHCPAVNPAVLAHIHRYGLYTVPANACPDEDS